MSNYKLIIFDCDGVLVDTEKIGNRILAQHISQLGYPMSTEEALAKFSGNSFHETMASVERLIGEALPRNFEQNYRKATYHAFSIELDPIQGVEQVLQNAPLPYCVGSNGPKDKMLLNLQKVKLLEYFNPNHIHSAYEIGIWKPDPRMYKAVAQNMQVAPYDCIVIEDSEVGVAAGVRAGMKVFRYVAHAAQPVIDKNGVTEFNDMQLLLPLLGTQLN